ncbi:MAG: hypothetical protein GF418_13570 [Chitinivibrionales bacterium]|nr:hypothetical protein [Chitinivibrionales bacterium]MBD3396649.1 hypothetical protein [Chitinivibrionales bacterium]
MRIVRHFAASPQHRALVCIAGWILAASALDPDTMVIPLRVSDSATISTLDSMEVIADASNAYYEVEILQPREANTGSTVSDAVYIAMHKIGDRLDRQVYRLKTLAAPKVERIELGDLALKMTVSYDLDISNKSVTATVTFDRLVDRSN